MWNLVAMNIYRVLNPWNYASAKLRGFTVNHEVQLFSGAAKSLVIPEILSVQVLSVVNIPISVGVEMCHNLRSNYLSTVGILAACHLKLCPPGTPMWACLWPHGQVLGKEGEGCGQCDMSCISCVVPGCRALNSSDMAVPTGVCLSMHGHSLRPLHLPQQCCWSHVTRAHFGAAHFFLLVLCCTHPSIIYSAQLQVRFHESVDLTFGVRPLWILVWCVWYLTTRRECIFSLFRV